MGANGVPQAFGSLYYKNVRSKKPLYVDFQAFAVCFELVALFAHFCPFGARFGADGGASVENTSTIGLCTPENPCIMNFRTVVWIWATLPYFCPLGPIWGKRGAPIEKWSLPLDSTPLKPLYTNFLGLKHLFWRSCPFFALLGPDLGQMGCPGNFETHFFGFLAPKNHHRRQFEGFNAPVKSLNFGLFRHV